MGLRRELLERKVAKATKRLAMAKERRLELGRHAPPGMVVEAKEEVVKWVERLRMAKFLLSEEGRSESK